MGNRLQKRKKIGRITTKVTMLDHTERKYTVIYDVSSSIETDYSISNIKESKLFDVYKYKCVRRTIYEY